MPAKRSKNFRSGDLAEELGLYIMRNLALVAPISRTEDVGIDAVVTLLEDYDKNNSIATDSFFLQIKSANEENITYKPDEVKWLFDLELPFFIARVDRAQQKLCLYCCHRLSEAFLGNSNRRENLTIVFEEYDRNDFFIDSNVVPVGPPVFRVSLTDCLLNEKRKQFIKLCKLHVAEEKLNLRTRNIGFINNLEWKEGSAIQHSSIPLKYSPKGNAERANDINNYGKPYLHSMIGEALENWDVSEIKNIIQALEKVRDYIDRSESDEPDFEHVVCKLGKDGVYRGGGLVMVPAGDEIKHFDPKKFFSGKNSSDNSSSE